MTNSSLGSHHLFVWGTPYPPIQFNTPKLLPFLPPFSLILPMFFSPLPSPPPFSPLPLFCHDSLFPFLFKLHTPFLPILDLSHFKMLPKQPSSRPFECVRRAWHSERHQPIRGSLIQDIFRVVSEVHCPATKKNKEWQDKLPIVVLKAEEILYSKADSEAEYMDITTLWGRINEAINTIIRLDEDTETGDFLRPCIEAALYLGCTPRRSSRSNRGSNLRGYLTSCTPQMLDTSSHYNAIRPAGSSSQHFSYCPSVSNVRPKNKNLVGNPNRVSINPKSSTVYKNIWPSIGSQQFLTGTVSGWNMFSLCPLYNGSNQHDPGIEIQPKPLYNNLSFSGPAPFKYFHSSNPIAVMKNRVDLANSTLHEQPKPACDLSLRLGPLSVPHPSINNSQSKTIKDIAANESKKQITSSSDRTFHLEKTLPFFPLHGTH